MPKNVVITGASSGIGEALAERFASQGYNLGLAALFGARNVKSSADSVLNWF